MRPLRLRTVLVATDLDPSSDAAIDSAHRLVNAAGAALHVVHVLAPTAAAQAQDDSGRAVRAALSRASVAEGNAKVHLIPGSPAETVQSLADRLAADVIVLGPHRADGRSASGRPLGSTAQAVVARTFAPCLVTAQPLRLPLERVLAPIDLSETARGALLVALSWASALRAGAAADRPTTLTALHVASAAEKQGTTEQSAAVLREVAMLSHGAGDWAGVDVQAVVTRAADAAAAITSYAVDRKADLVVVGTRGLGMDEVSRLGSVSASLVTRLELPMLLVPPGVWRAYAAVP